MVDYTTVIQKFEQNGEKTGWTYVDVPADVAEQLKPGNKRTFRVKGLLDNYAFSGIALLPMGDGNFIMAINANMRKGIRKSEGAMLRVQLEEHADFSIQPPDELVEALQDDPASSAYFDSLAKSHRDYFVKWIDSAKTPETRVKRIVQTVRALEKRQSYGEMIRSNRKDKNF